METVSRHLVLHGSIIFLVALLFGAPYAKAIKRNAEAQVVNSWRVAHQSLTIGALVLFAAAALMTGLAVSQVMKWAIAVPLIISGYAFLVATPLAAITKDRGLQSGAQGLARVVYLGNMVGVAGSLLGSALLVIAALVTL
jgi:hypothetical protein